MKKILQLLLFSIFLYTTACFMFYLLSPSSNEYILVTMAIIMILSGVINVLLLLMHSVEKIWNITKDILEKEDRELQQKIDKLQNEIYEQDYFTHKPILRSSAYKFKVIENLKVLTVYTNYDYYNHNVKSFRELEENVKEFNKLNRKKSKLNKKLHNIEIRNHGKFHSPDYYINIEDVPF